MEKSDSASDVQYAVGFTPQTVELADGSWEASYPGDEWSVTAESKEAAIEMLKAEELQRIQDPVRRRQRREAIKREHLVTPVPGVAVMDAKLFHHLVTEKVTRAEIDRVFEEAERRRAVGQPYSVADYVADHSGEE
jgi:hypothetical protein